MEHFKYPRSPHLPFSPGATSDDVYLNDTSHFIGKEIVITEKYDGESTGIYKDGIHARSLDSRHHPSRSYVNKIYGRLKNELPANMRLAGENCYAVHSIKYNSLPDWFLLFGIYIEVDGIINCISWDETIVWASLLDLKTVSVLYRGVWNEDVVRGCYTGVSTYNGLQEGYVVRLADKFPIDEFGISLAKYVRENHIQTDEHWMSKAIEVNGLKL